MLGMSSIRYVNAIRGVLWEAGEIDGEVYVIYGMRGVGATLKEAARGIIERLRFMICHS